jgi:hypothetical protein
MVEHLKSLADKDERNKCATAIVSVMRSVVPQEGDKEEVEKKLWGQLFLMADYDLDVDCPGEKPTRESRSEAPSRLNYPNAQSRLGHYGQMTRDLIEKAKAYEEGEEKAALVLTIANLMKRHYLTWNRGTVENSLIREQLKEMSGGVLTLAEDVELVSSAEVLKSKRKTSDAMDRWRGKKKRR